MGKRKKVILTIIDSFHPKALYSALKSKLVPALSFLKDKGSLRTDCVSSFPTMTPTASSSIVTGCYPDQHHVPGFIWFDRKEKRFINYGASFEAIWKIGPFQVIQDLVFNLNKKQLSKMTKTIFEALEERGFSTAAINFFIYRGKNSFAVKVPWLVNLLVRFKFLEGLLGPKILFFGEMCSPLKLFKEKNLNLPIGPFQKFGVNDEFSGIVSSQIIKEGLQPDFMLVYLPDTDGYAHRNNPRKTEQSLMKADQQLQRILNAYESWDKALEENVFIIVGDHAQTLIHNKENFNINLEEILADYKQAKVGKKIFLKKDIAICPNERMAFIYLLNDSSKLLREIVEKLKQDNRIDQIAWVQERGSTRYYNVIKGGESTRLIFWRGGNYVDNFKQSWGYEGDLRVLDANRYPDALQRLSAILDCKQAGELVITARPGYEIGGEAAALHPGCGSHGSLHREDSLVPLVIAGSDQFREVKRLTDIAPAILRYFR